MPLACNRYVHKWILVFLCCRVTDLLCCGGVEVFRQQCYMVESGTTDWKTDTATLTDVHRTSIPPIS